MCFAATTSADGRQILRIIQSVSLLFEKKTFSSRLFSQYSRSARQNLNELLLFLNTWLHAFGWSVAVLMVHATAMPSYYYVSNRRQHFHMSLRFMMSTNGKMKFRQNTILKWMLRAESAAELRLHLNSNLRQLSVFWVHLQFEQENSKHSKFYCDSARTEHRERMHVNSFEEEKFCCRRKCADNETMSQKTRKWQTV